MHISLNIATSTSMLAYLLRLLLKLLVIRTITLFLFVVLPKAITPMFCGKIDALLHEAKR